MKQEKSLKFPGEVRWTLQSLAREKFPIRLKELAKRLNINITKLLPHCMDLSTHGLVFLNSGLDGELSCQITRKGLETVVSFDGYILISCKTCEKKKRQEGSNQVTCPSRRKPFDPLQQDNPCTKWTPNRKLVEVKLNSAIFRD